MPSLRCSMCGLSWPPEQRYQRCPSCAEKTDPVGNVEPDGTPEEMQSIANHFEFERFYADKHKPNLELSASEQERFTLENWRAEHNARLHAIS